MLDFWNDDARRTCKKCGNESPRSRSRSSHSSCRDMRAAITSLHVRSVACHSHRSYVKIDLHTHILPRDWPDLDAKYGYAGFVRLDHYQAVLRADDDRRPRLSRDHRQRLGSEAPHRGDATAHGVSMQVLSTVPVMFSYWAKPADALDLSRRLNDHIAEVVRAIIRSASPGLATIPLQDPDLAAQRAGALRARPRLARRADRHPRRREPAFRPHRYVESR